MKMSNGDYDVLYALVKDKKLSSGKSFEETLAPHFGGIDKLRAIEREAPLLTMFVPSLPENSFSAEKWNSESQIPFVAIRLSNTNDVPIISPEGEEYMLDSELIPSYPVVVIKDNERMMYKGQHGYELLKSERVLTNSEGVNYKFVDDVFDNELNTANLHRGVNLRTVFDYELDQKLHDAFTIHNPADGWQRDYIYYNITPTNIVSPLRYDFVETITYFEIVDNALTIYRQISNAVTGDPYAREGKNNSGWTDGNFEIRANAFVQGRNGIANVPNSKYLNGATLFNITYRSEKKGFWPFRSTYYYINTVTANPQHINMPLVPWDLSSYSTTFRIDFEETDNPTIVTSKITQSAEFATNFEFNIPLGETAKVGLKFGASSKFTETKELTVSQTLTSNPLGTFVINFADKIITEPYDFSKADPLN